MKTNKNHLPLKTFPSIENYWKRGNEYKLRLNTAHYPKLPIEELFSDGWRDVVIPQLEVDQKLGELFYDEVNDKVTYHVLTKTAEEIEEENRVQVPFSITPTQGRILLKKMDLLDQVNTMMENALDEEMKIYWEYALSWDRDNTYINSMSNLLGMGESDLDNFFIEADKIS